MIVMMNRLLHACCSSCCCRPQCSNYHAISMATLFLTSFHLLRLASLRCRCSIMIPVQPVALRAAAAFLLVQSAAALCMPAHARVPPAAPALALRVDNLLLNCTLCVAGLCRVAATAATSVVVVRNALTVCAPSG